MDKQEVLNHLARARTQLLAAVKGLSEVEMTTLPVSEIWTLREVLAHIGGWAMWDLETIRATRQGRHPDLSIIQNVDIFNNELVAERNEWSVAQIFAEIEDAQVAMQELLSSMSNQDLFDIGTFQGPYWDNLAEWLQVAWEHEEEHTAQILLWRKQRNI